MVHFSAKATNAVHHHWFSEGYSKKTDFKTDQMFFIISGDGLNP